MHFKKKSFNVYFFQNKFCFYYRTGYFERAQLTYVMYKQSLEITWGKTRDMKHKAIMYCNIQSRFLELNYQMNLCYIILGS